MKMYEIISVVLSWSELWVLIIPLLVLLRYKRQPGYLKPIIVYLFLALVLNGAANVMMEINTYYHADIYNNNFIYNMLSILRLICFGMFFILLRQTSTSGMKQFFLLLSLVFIAINFIFKFENFCYLSSRLLACEAGVLLIYCLQYYLTKLQQDTFVKRQPDFWVVLGLSIYVVFNFFYFLMYDYLSANFSEPDSTISTLDIIWNIHNVSYIILCIFIAKAFYVPSNK